VSSGCRCHLCIINWNAFDLSLVCALNNELMSANRVGIIQAELDFALDAGVVFDPSVEVQLDCYMCHRRCRTVVFRVGASQTICMPSKHDFPGRLVNHKFHQHGSWHIAEYKLEYEYQMFRDVKYPDEKRYGSKEPGAPTWARVSFNIVCPNCGQKSRHSTQNNISRPWQCVCKCGFLLYSETTEMPQLSWHAS
jgi:hypothetical protein